MFSLAQQPQSIWRVLCDGSRLFKASLLQVWPWQFILLLPLLLLSLPSLNKLDLQASVSDPKSLPAAIGIFAIIILISLIPLIGYCFSIHRIYNVAIQSNTTSKTSLITALRKFIPVLVTTILIFTVFFIAELVILGIFALLWQYVSQLVAILAGIAFLIPLTCAVLFTLFLLSFYLQLIILDDYSIFKAMKQSCRLVWGNWWRNFAIVFFLTIVGGLISTIVLSLLPNSTPAFIAVLLDIFMLSLLYPWYFSVLQAQFHDLKLRLQRKTIATTTIAT